MDRIIAEIKNWVDRYKNITETYQSKISNAFQAAGQTAAPVAQAPKLNYYTHPRASEVVLTKGAKAVALNSDAEMLLKSMLAATNQFSATYTSTLRTYEDQARIMITQQNLATVKKLGYYGRNQQFLDDYVKFKAKGDQAGFAEYLRNRDAANKSCISNHIKGIAIDLGKNSEIENYWISKVGGSSGIKKILPEDNCTHIEFNFNVTGVAAMIGGGGSKSTVPVEISKDGSIQGSVGRNGKNQANDVATIQDLLNKKANAGLVVDGISGNKTVTAIAKYQQTVLNMSKPDGRVDVGGATWRSLTSGSSNPQNNNTPPAPSPEKPVVPSNNEPQPISPENNTPNVAPSIDKEIKGSVGKGGINNPEDVVIIREILVKTWNYKIAIHNKSDAELENAIKDFQAKKVGANRPDARVDVNGTTWKVLIGKRVALVSTGQKIDVNKIPGQAPAATPHSEYVALAEKYDIEVATIYAIKEVESGGGGYLPDGRPKILFEGHVFWAQLKSVGIDPNAHRKGNENIIYPEWDKSQYKGGVGEYSRLNRAIAIHREAALKSASWGEFQIMGANHKMVGYADVDSFINAIQTQGNSNIKSMLLFCESKNLLKHVGKGSKNWAGFAYGYNGSKYAENQYDTKLAAAYAKFKKMYP